MTETEYRVCWQRKGDRRLRYRVYQSRRGAQQCVQFLLGELSEEPWPAPALTVPPYIEVRDVSPWQSINQTRIEVA